jgi:hypothetical protein
VSPDLERRLTDLGRHLEFPPTPPLAAMVRPHLTRPSRGPRITRWRVVLAAAIAILGVAFGVPPVRTAIAHWLGIQGVVINPVRSLPTPSGPGANLNLGRRSSLESARQSAGFRLLVPQALGAPDAVYTRFDIGPAVSLVYAPRAGLPQSRQTGVGLLVTEFRGATDPVLIQKFVGPGTTVLPVTVNGGSGFWLGGAPHEVAYALPDGSLQPDTLRLSGPTLVFENGPVTIRIEGAVTEAQALAIARSLH